MRRWIAGRLHALAYWLDRRADDIWDIDEFLASFPAWPQHSHLSPDAYNSAGEQSCVATADQVRAAFDDVLQRHATVFDKLKEIDD